MFDIKNGMKSLLQTDVEKGMRKTMGKMPTCCKSDEGEQGGSRGFGLRTGRICCDEGGRCCCGRNRDKETVSLEKVSAAGATRTHSITQISRDLSKDLGEKTRLRARGVATKWGLLHRKLLCLSINESVSCRSTHHPFLMPP